MRGLETKDSRANNTGQGRSHAPPQGHEARRVVIDSRTNTNRATPSPLSGVVLHNVLPFMTTSGGPPDDIWELLYPFGSSLNQHLLPTPPSLLARHSLLVRSGSAPSVPYNWSGPNAPHPPNRWGCKADPAARNRATTSGDGARAKSLACLLAWELGEPAGLEACGIVGEGG